MKILEITEFSSGICGVWQRVKQESLEFSKLGHEVKIVSSDIEKGTNKQVCKKDSFEGIQIKRLSSNADFLDFSFLSKNVTYFNPEKEIRSFEPNLVITHLLHPHSIKALKICKKLEIPIYLVPHAPFNVKRKFPLNFLTKVWNWRNSFRLKDFDKIIAITHWEKPFLKKLGVLDQKIIYIPNGIPEEFFTQKKVSASKDVLFLGRIAPIKNLEILIEVAKELPSINFSFVGGAEKNYLKKLKKNAPKNVFFYPPTYELSQKIKLIDEHKILVLPSHREAMPQVLIEAMARGKIVLASNTDGAKEIISPNKNGFIFKEKKDLKNLIIKNINGEKFISSNAKKDSKKYLWKDLIKKYPLD